MPAAASAASSFGPAAPDAFLCPISQELMTDPVIATDGHSYERGEIEKWFATGKQTSPMTNSAMASQTLVPNHGLKSQINEWQGQSNAQRIADLITAVVLTDDATEVERQLGSLAQFVGHNKVVVQPQTLRKLKGMLGDAPTAVHEALRVVEAECRLVVAEIAARLRDERRIQSLAAAAMAAAKSKLAQLDIEISVAEEALKKLKADRKQQAGYVSGLARAEQECGSSVAKVEEELNGYPEPLGLLEEAGSEMGLRSDERADTGQQTEAKRKRGDGEEELGTEVAKRQRATRCLSLQRHTSEAQCGAQSDAQSGAQHGAQLHGKEGLHAVNGTLRRGTLASWPGGGYKFTRTDSSTAVNGRTTYRPMLTEEQAHAAVQALANIEEPALDVTTPSRSRYTRHFSVEKQRFFHHDAATGKSTWETTKLDAEGEQYIMTVVPEDVCPGKVLTIVVAGTHPDTGQVHQRPLQVTVPQEGWRPGTIVKLKIQGKSVGGCDFRLGA